MKNELEDSVLKFFYIGKDIFVEEKLFWENQCWDMFLGGKSMVGARFTSNCITCVIIRLQLFCEWAELGNLQLGTNQKT